MSLAKAAKFGWMVCDGALTDDPLLPGLVTRGVTVEDFAAIATLSVARR